VWRSSAALAVLTSVFENGTDISFARQMVLERMRAAEESVPAMYGRPAMGPIATGLGEAYPFGVRGRAHSALGRGGVYQFVVRGQGHSLMELEETLDWYIGPQLRTVPGIVEVNSFGGEDKQYPVVIDTKRVHAAASAPRV